MNTLNIGFGEITNSKEHLSTGLILSLVYALLDHYCHYYHHQYHDYNHGDDASQNFFSTIYLYNGVTY